MNIPSQPSYSDGVVLVAAGDTFEAGYIADTLEARGIPVLRACIEPDEVQPALQRTGRVRAAVIGHHWANKAPELLDAVTAADIPWLLLMPSQTTPRAAYPVDTPILAKPFAAYQVADWVVAAIDRQAAAGPQPVGDEEQR
jgi:hypothetical protein